MALFKVFRGPKEEFSEDFSKIPFHDGYAYFVNDTGLFYIDYVDRNGAQIRKKVNSGTAAALTNGTDILDIADINSMVDNATTIAYNVTVNANNWATDSTGGYKWTYQNTNLRCGENGNIPPIIVCKSNQDEYNNITEGDATAGYGITFKVSKKPTAAIELIIIDIA